MDLRNSCPIGRLELLRSVGVPISEADEKRVADSVAASLASLVDAVQGSLFDTEPQTFDVVMKKLAARTAS